MENKFKQTQLKQIEFLRELFEKSSFAKRWSIKAETVKLISQYWKARDQRSVSVAVRPTNEAEKEELAKIEKQIAEKAQAEPETFGEFEELEISKGLGAGEKFPHYTKVNDVMKETEGEILHQAGEVILLDVWATWCGPCQRPMQHNQDMLVKNAEKWKGKVRIIAVSVDDGREEVLKRITEKNWDKINHYRLNGWDGEHPIIKDYSIRGIPFVALIDTHGVINFTGHPSEVNLEDRINDLIEGKGSTKSQYKLTKKFISTQLAEYVSSQDSKDLGFDYTLSITKTSEIKHDSVTKSYNFPSASATVDKKYVASYTKLKNHVTASLQNITIKQDREQIRDIKAELKKDTEALAKIYEKHNLKNLENKLCISLKVTYEGGKLSFAKSEHFNQHKKLVAVKPEEKEAVEKAAEEQRDFAIGKYRSGQYADYLEQMFHKSIQSTETEPVKPKSQEGIYRKYKDLLQSKEFLDQKLEVNLSYNTKFTISLKRKRVFDYKGGMKEKIHYQPVCKYVIRESDAQKFQTEFVDKVLAKFDQKDIIVKPEVLKCTPILEGKNCKTCNADLVVPYYFNPFQKEHYCLACGDKKDETHKTIKQFAVPHNLVLVTTTDKTYLNDVDEYKIGKDVQPPEDQEIEFEYGYMCNGCGGGGKNTRYVCLNCRPGPRRGGGFVDFCHECVKKQVFDKDEAFMKEIQKSDTEHNFSHTYIKIITPQGNYAGY